MAQHTDTSVVETLSKTSPPVVVTGLTLGGVSLNEWVMIATLAYTVLQLFFLVRDKVYRPWKEKRDAQ